MYSCLEITSDGKKIPVIDYLKGFSITTIVLMHLLALMPSVPDSVITLSAIGGTGVHVFFLCSGIGLYLSHLKHPLGYGAFLKKRFLKIYTPYILIIFLSFCLPWMYSGKDRITALLSHVFLFKMFVPRYEESFGVQFWFVSTLFQLYFLFLPMCRLKNRLKNNALFFGIFMGCSILWWIFCYCTGLNQVRIWGSFCLQNIWEFSLGFLLAEAFYEGKQYRIHNLLLLALAAAGIGLQAGLALFSDALKSFNDIPGLIGYGSLALLLSNIPFVEKLCTKVSSFSYELFLVHMLVFETGFHFVKPQGLMMESLWGCTVLAAAMIFACIYRNIRKPGSGLRKAC